MNIINDKVAELTDFYFRPFDDETDALRKACEDVENLMILKETESFLRLYLGELRPRSILEIGTAHGYSAILFAKLLPDTYITTIERRSDFREKAVENIDKSGLSGRIKVLQGDALEVLKDLNEAQNPETFDFVFIDAAKSHYKDFFDLSEHMCVKDSVIICDNIFMDAMLVDNMYDNRRRHRTSVKRMHEFLKYIDEREDLELTLLTCGDGLAIIRFND